MKTIIVLYRSEWITTPEEFELAIDKKQFIDFRQKVASLQAVVGDVFSVDLAIEIYYPKEEDLEDFRVGQTCLTVYPKKDISYKDWSIHQKFTHKHNFEEFVESEEFSIAQLEKHFEDKGPGKYHIQIDQKVTMWERCSMNVEANSKEEAIEKAKKYVALNGDIDVEGVSETDWDTLYNTYEKLTPYQNYALSNIDSLFPDKENTITSKTLKESLTVEVVETYEIEL